MKSIPGEPKTPRTLFGSNIPRELIYTPSTHPVNYQNMGNAGEVPFTRGIHPTMYRGKEFTMRQITGFGLPEDTNNRLRFMLGQGATGISIVFDMPTIQMRDSDHPLSRGHIGLSGVCVDSIEDMHTLFANIPIDKISTSIVTHYPSNTAVLFAMFLAMTEERGVAWDTLKGSVQNDTTMEEIVIDGADVIPPKSCFKIQCDNIEFIHKHLPLWNCVTLNGYNLRECGTSGITEVAVAFANGLAVFDEMLRRGVNLDEIATRIAFFWAVSNDFFEEIARLRAARRLWCRLLQERFHLTNPRSLWMRCHVQTSGSSLTQEEPHNNIIRAAYQSLAAILGGTQSLHVDAYDEAYSIPSEEAALLSLRTQQIIQKETAITDVVDPLGGSYYIEALTDTIEGSIRKEIDAIEAHGGYVASIESGIFKKQIDRYIYEQHQKVDSGEIAVVGKNCHRLTGKSAPIQVFYGPESAEAMQRERLHNLRMTRDNAQATASLRELREACRCGENLLPHTIQCAKSRCTKGEMYEVIQQSFGTWTPRHTKEQP